MFGKILGAIRKPKSAAVEEPRSEYEIKLEREQTFYRDVVNVHDLPAIHHYWHVQHLLEKFQRFGISHPGGMFEVELEKRCRSAAGTRQRILSIGSGNCDLEVGLALYLRGKQLDNFVIECLDLNPDMLERGLASAREKGLDGHIAAHVGDFNRWKPQREYDVVLANQSLHHVVNLEGLFSSITDGLARDGLFLTSDMIGRNGHMRWPEALAIVHEFWTELPKEYRYNQQLRRYEDLYENWDCSAHGFEGIRSQDILPLLVERFHFEMFFAFGNVIDPFVDRGFGHNFHAEAEWDRAFIDRVHARDESAMQAGEIKPTHMVAILRKEAPAPMKFIEPMTPEFAIRRQT